ncbi:MAG: radical SAM protein [Elusimicrobiota bacterium]
MSFNLKKCNVCPIECGVDRTKNRGACGAGEKIEVSSWNLHFGEEPPISGIRGSGTIFFAHCSLKCIFCQNYPISHLGNGEEITREILSDIILDLQRSKAHNINLVTPTHYTPQIKDVLEKIKSEKLKIPVVYNCGGYEKSETLKELEGLVDIYMPDTKFSEPEVAEKLCNARDYREVNQKALKEMHRQVGKLNLSSNGIAKKGVLVRHLVLPNNLSGTEKILKFIAEELGKDTYISLMSQYHPAHKAVDNKLLNRKIYQQEYRDAVEMTKKLGLENCFYQKA